MLALESGRVLTMGSGYVGQIQRGPVFQQLPPGAAATSENTMATTHLAAGSPRARDIAHDSSGHLAPGRTW